MALYNGCIVFYCTNVRISADPSLMDSGMFPPFTMANSPSWCPCVKYGIREASRHGLLGHRLNNESVIENTSFGIGLPELKSQVWYFVAVQVT